MITVLQAGSRIISGYFTVMRFRASKVWPRVFTAPGQKLCGYCQTRLLQSVCKLNQFYYYNVLTS